MCWQQVARSSATHRSHNCFPLAGRWLADVPPTCTPTRGGWPPSRSGAKYKKLRTRYDAENSLAKYEPFIVQSKNFP